MAIGFTNLEFRGDKPVLEIRPWRPSALPLIEITKEINVNKEEVLSLSTKSFSVLIIRGMRKNKQRRVRTGCQFYRKIIRDCFTLNSVEELTSRRKE